MNVWLVTLGSSDVQVKDADLWSDWYREVKGSLYGIDRARFNPTRLENSDDVPYRLAARVLGIAYEKLGEAVTEQLVFPLLEQFQRQLLDKAETIDNIVVLTSDQQYAFSEEERESYRCPYWQDTGLLYPIVCDYLQSLFPAAQISQLSLSPDGPGQGLDDWDAVLKLVRRKIAALDFEPSKAVLNKVSVSHQAGTPAISSAVQFSSLAKFGDRVEFLVSSEYRPEQTRLIDSSEYLSALRLQEAKALLDRYDYSGVKTLIGGVLDRQTQTLLDAGIQWNLADFQNFQKLLLDSNFVQSEDCMWWSFGYESAYLAVIRHRQGNIVDALFHSFRSVEGLICIWAETKYKACIIHDKKGSPQITEKIQAILPEYWKWIEEKHHNWLKDQREKNQVRVNSGEQALLLSTGLFSQTLYTLLETVRPESKKNKYMKTVLYSAKDERNQQFHRLLGLQEENLFQAWKAKNAEEWKDVLLGCLNFISEVNPIGNFESIESASLMAKVHESLKSAIEAYETKV